MALSKGLDSELESFRQQWLSEVRTKQGQQCAEETVSAENLKAPPQRAPSPSDTRTAATAAPAAALQAQLHDEQDSFRSGTLEEASAAEPSGITFEGSARLPPGRELVSALDHYEEAMAKEAEGNMGESLMLYRRAYRLDHRVDRQYREKHFPASHQPQKQAPAQQATASTSTAAPLSPSTQPAASSQIASSKPDPASAPEPAAVVILSTEDLIASFSNLQIQPAPPAIEDTPPDPCPISALPRELLVHILREVALHDVGDFARLSLVCKSLAYLVTTSQHIWRDVCLGPKFGFFGMHYHWNKATDWSDLSPPSSSLSSPFETSTTSRDVLAQRRNRSTALSKALVGTPEFPSWKQMFRSRPRIRFNGCYISTVNYIRMGQASTNQATWGGSPVHIVTYYRYLRFFRDGTAISLLTTWEPSAVVGHFTPEMLRLHQPQHQHRDYNAYASLPSAVMQKAYRGRWRLSSCCCFSLDDDHEHHSGDPGVHDPERLCSAGKDEADLTVETETHDPKYMFRMDLSLRTAGKAARNNKLVWRSHFSYNRLTDDWAEFTLKHDKAFFFSRVRSYGMGW
ncbi:hypothetical protein E4U58_000125 [Claviceps cyperi]|nr:hypothetical protein E4U58_000125 [Claviceps cyperi]